MVISQLTTFRSFPKYMISFTLITYSQNLYIFLFVSKSAVKLHTLNVEKFRIKVLTYTITYQISPHHFTI